MATRTWNGTTADWNTDADWTPATSDNDVPKPGDVAVIATGMVLLTTNTGPNQVFENNQVRLGSSAGATLLLQNQRATGRYFNVAITGSATIEADGNRGFAGSITGNPNDGSTITLKADPGGELVLLHGGSFNVTDRAIDFEGDVTLERDASIAGNIINNGTLSILSGQTTFASNSLTGTGTISIGGYGKLNLQQTPVPVTQTISFAGLGGTLALSYSNAGTFKGSIQNFAPGDFISFIGFGTVTSATLDASTHVLTIDDSTGRSYVFNNVNGAAGTLTSVHQANGSDLIGYTSAAPQLNYQIDAGSRAMRADVVHGTTIPGTSTKITGAGVRIGIISNSFNVNGGAAADVANGYLPASGVTVLREGSAGDTDEGRAMAELIHQVAPGSDLYFASSGGSINDFASSVRALQAAGCTVIVDDISLIGSEPFFQLGSPAETAISDAIAGGVTFVTSAGNYGDACYQHAFTTSQQTLLDGSVVQGMTFSNGTPYQSITANGGLFDKIDLQWDAPFYGVGGVASDQPCSVTFKVFDATTNALVGTSQQVSLDGHLVAESELFLPFTSSATNYNIAIYQTDGAPVISQIKYIISGALTGASVGGRINDPDAGVGSGAIFGHALVPGVISVAAADVTNTEAFGQSPDYTEWFSSTGTGTLLFDEAGNRLDQPVSAGSPDVTGPDGIQTSVTGFTPFYGTSAAAPNVAAVAALLQQVNPEISPDAVSSILTQTAQPLDGTPSTIAGAGLVQADAAIQLAEQIACYCTGTLILTNTGERPVETLAIGDQVITASGRTAPVRWIGRRSYAGRFLAGRSHLLPIRFSAGSLGDGLPRRDLFVSPQHAMFLDGALVPAALLVNGTSIVRADRVSRVDYFHLELDSHDVILAEGAPSESFIDDDSRGIFHNADEYRALYPDAPAGPACYCAPRVEGGAALEAIRARLRARSEGAREPRGPLSGRIDKITHDTVTGWARDAADPYHPVWLQVFDNGVPVAMVVADLDRPDVRSAGFGHGPCGFMAVVPGGFAPHVDHVVEVRRVLDDAPLGSPLTRTATPGAGASAPGQGMLDEADRHRVLGWAQDPGNPGTPVALRIFCNGAPLGDVLADRLRSDLATAGIGDGRHAFEFAIPPGALPKEHCTIEVRRIRDGVPLAGSPAIVGAAEGFDPALERALDAAVTGLVDAGDQDRVLSFMVAQTERLLQRQADAQAGRRDREAFRQFRRRWGTEAAESGPGLRALVIDEVIPVAGRDAGSNAVLSHMQALRSLGYAVSLVAAGDLAPARSAVAALESDEVTCCTAPLYASVEDVLRRQAGCFDVVYLHRAAIATRYLGLARAHQPGARVLYSVADLHHLRLERQAAAEGWPELLAVSRRVRVEEFTAAWMADAVITHSATEAALLRRAVPEAAVHHVAWDVPLREAVAPWDARSGVAFIGSYGHAPNRDAASWLVESVMPLVWQVRPEIRCLLAGSGMPQVVRDLARPGVEVLGQVDDLWAAVFERVRLTVAPLRFGAGLKGKVLDSLAAGVPCVMSEVAAEGMLLPSGLRGLVGRDAKGMAALICRLHQDQTTNRALADAGASWIGRTFGADTIAAGLRSAIERQVPVQAAGLR